MTGRPTKYTPEREKTIIQGIRAGLTQKDAALIAGINERTLQRWAIRYTAFAANLARAHAERSANWLARIATLAAEQRDWRAYAELLDRCAPEYRKRTQIDVTVRDLAKTLAADLDCTAEELIAEAEAIAAGAWGED